MVLIKNKSSIDRTDFFYPSSCHLISKKTDLLKMFSNSTVYGVCLAETKIQYDSSLFTLQAESYFSLSITSTTKKFLVDSTGNVALFIRYGFKSLNQIGLNCEESGRLTYIDGCTDSALISPPRYGDPSLNLLCFPAATLQSFHRHPTLRFGVILSGSGFADLNNKSHPLKKGDAFLIEENELHRFKTESKSMRLIAFHPDSDFGPKDNDHAMLNRTYLNK